MFGRSYTVITNTNPVTGQLTQNRISKRSVTESDVVVQFSLTKDRSSIKRVKSLKRVSSLKNLIAKANRTLYNVDSSKVVYKAGLSKKTTKIVYPEVSPNIGSSNFNVADTHFDL